MHSHWVWNLPLMAYLNIDFPTSSTNFVVVWGVILKRYISVTFSGEIDAQAIYSHCRMNIKLKFGVGCPLKWYCRLWFVFRVVGRENGSVAENSEQNSPASADSPNPRDVIVITGKPEDCESAKAALLVSLLPGKDGFGSKALGRLDPDPGQSDLSLSNYCDSGKLTCGQIKKILR